MFLALVLPLVLPLVLVWVWILVLVQVKAKVPTPGLTLTWCSFCFFSCFPSLKLLLLLVLSQTLEVRKPLGFCSRLFPLPQLPPLS